MLGQRIVPCKKLTMKRKVWFWTWKIVYEEVLVKFVSSKTGGKFDEKLLHLCHMTDIFSQKNRLQAHNNQHQTPDFCPYSVSLFIPAALEISQIFITNLSTINNFLGGFCDWNGVLHMIGKCEKFNYDRLSCIRYEFSEENGALYRRLFFQKI